MDLTIKTAKGRTILTLSDDGQTVETWATPTGRVGLDMWIDRTIVEAARRAGGNVTVHDLRK